MISRIITIDQSTSATKAMLFSEDCELLHRVNIEHQQFYPQIGWVEHDAEEIYKNTIEAIHCLLEQEEVNGKDISYSLAITNQRETVVVWNRHTGKSVYHAVVWQCQRGAAICKELKDKGYSELVQRKTGLLIDPYFSASGAKWILDNVENGRELAEKGDLFAIFSTGAYGFSMASNYNNCPIPAVVLVREGKSSIIVKRQSYEHMTANHEIPEWL